jgi:hypothetical protein
VGTDNQQERPEPPRLGNPQRLYAEPRTAGMRQSELHGDVQSAAEMTAPVWQDPDE